MSFRARMMMWTAVLSLLLAAAFGGRVLSRVAFALERGKIQAANAELLQLGEELASIEKVSQAFHLVSKVTQPGVVQIQVEGGERADEEVDRMLRDAQRGFSEELRRELRDGDEGDQGDPHNLESLRRFYKNLPPGAGSGFIFDEDGYILTNNHVVANRTGLRVLLYDNRQFDAEIIGTDPKTDLAVIKIEASDLHVLPFGDSDHVQVGDWALAIGAPFGLTQTVTHGIVSAVGRAEIEHIDIYYQNFIQTDAAVNPGNSGGPLLNLRGEVIGVNTAIATHGDGQNAGVAFVIPARTAKRVSAALKKSGRVARGWLGVAMADVDQVAAEIFGLDSARGVLIHRLFEGMPADKAGLEVDDLILALNGVPLNDDQQLMGLIAEQDPGSTVALEVVRDGAKQVFQVRLDEQPEDIRRVGRMTPGRSYRWIPKMRAGFRTYVPDRLLGFHEKDRGLLVVNQGEFPDLENFVLLTECNGRTIKTIADLTRAIADVPAGGKVEIRVEDPTGDALVFDYELSPME
ncbi:MAG: S1C family serine protease [Phycisphaerae bacterium]